MDDRKIEALLTTIKTGSFSKAAEKLNCTQSAVTQMMNTFEDELGFRVLKRSHNGVRLTEAGELIYPHIIESYESMLRLRHNADRISSGKSVPLRIGAFSSISNTVLGPAILEYQEKNPDIGIQLTIATKELQNWLLNGEIDMVIGDVDIIKGFRWHSLIKDPYYAVFPTENLPEGMTEITVDELLQYPIIMPTLNDLNKYFSQAGHILDIACDDDTTVLNFVSMGLGVTALPNLSLWQLPKGVSILPITPEVTRTIGYALPSTPRKEALDFAKFIQENVRDHGPMLKRVNLTAVAE